MFYCKAIIIMKFIMKIIIDYTYLINNNSWYIKVMLIYIVDYSYRIYLVIKL